MKSTVKSRNCETDLFKSKCRSHVNVTVSYDSVRPHVHSHRRRDKNQTAKEKYSNCTNKPRCFMTLWRRIGKPSLLIGRNINVASKYLTQQKKKKYVLSIFTNEKLTICQNRLDSSSLIHSCKNNSLNPWNRLIKMWMWTKVQRYYGFIRVLWATLVSPCMSLQHARCAVANTEP